MHVLLVHCHPVGESYVAALRDAAVAALQGAGHEVEVLDLYATGFRAELNREERLTYHDIAANTGTVEAEVAQLRRADALVLVFPTWWYGMPALLKGWFDRVWVPGVAFDIRPDGNISTESLSRIRSLAVVTTSGSPWWLIGLVMGHPTKKVIGRGLRRLCARGCRFRWLQHYGMDKSTPDSRAAFLSRVSARLAAL